MDKHVVLAGVDLDTASLLPMLGIMHPIPGCKRRWTKMPGTG
jgi:hypothetical protein